ncbi:MAG: hypothetical protein JWR57_555 [Mycetocola sp.]|nr:hypothetical protein [Mycetocola sp.]
MFGRRRHRAPVTVALPAPVPAPGIQLSEEQLFERIRARLDQHMGATGDWTLVRRTGADTDAFFHEMAAFSLARELTTTIVGADTTVAADASATPAAEDAPPAHIVQTITVTTVPSSRKVGASDVDPAIFDAADDAADAARDLAKVEHVMFELNTVAVWADPQHHDPSHVNPEMVTPSLSRPKKRWNSTRVS